MPHTVPSEEYFAVARNIAMGEAARRHLDDASRDDFVQEAYVALLAEWPKLVRRFGVDVPGAFVNVVVQRRLVDFTRREVGRDHIKAHHGAAPIEWQEEDGTWRALQLRANVDVEGEVLDGLFDVDVDVERWLRYASGAKRSRLRALIRALAGGQTQVSIGTEWGVSESRVSQLVAELRRAVVRALADAA